MEKLLGELLSRIISRASYEWFTRRWRLWKCHWRWKLWLHVHFRLVGFVFPFNWWFTRDFVLIDKSVKFLQQKHGMDMAQTPLRHTQTPPTKLATNALAHHRRLTRFSACYGIIPFHTFPGCHFCLWLCRVVSHSHARACPLSCHVMYLLCHVMSVSCPCHPISGKVGVFRSLV